MIHSMPALAVGNPVHAAGGKIGKGGIEAAIVAMFSEALATQLKAGGAMTATGATLPTLQLYAKEKGSALYAPADSTQARALLGGTG